MHFQQRGIVQLSDNEFEAVETLRAKLTTLSEEAENEEPYEEKIRHALDLVGKLNSGDEGLILPNGVPETDQVASSDETPSSYGISCISHYLFYDVLRKKIFFFFNKRFDP